MSESQLWLFTLRVNVFSIAIHFQFLRKFLFKAFTKISFRGYFQEHIYLIRLLHDVPLRTETFFGRLWKVNFNVSTLLAIIVFAIKKRLWLILLRYQCFVSPNLEILSLRVSVIWKGAGHSGYFSRGHGPVQRHRPQRR